MQCDINHIIRLTDLKITQAIHLFAFCKNGMLLSNPGILIFLFIYKRTLRIQIFGIFVLALPNCLLKSIASHEQNDT